MGQKRYEDRNTWLSKVNKAHPKGLSCAGCPLEHVGAGFARTDGTGRNGIALLGEALGETEAELGIPFKGDAGMMLNRVLHRVALKRADFLIMNVLNCNPPHNLLKGASYEQSAIQHCDPYFDATIRANKQIQVIVPMGNTATYKLLGVDGVYTHHGTVHFSERYKKWVVPTFHPSYLLQSSCKEVLTVINDLNTAFDVRDNGHVDPVYDFIEYPTFETASNFVEEYFQALTTDQDVVLSCDIETPFSKDIDEEDKDGKDSSWTVERISFTFRAGHAITMPWCEPFTSISRRLLGSTGDKLFWNGNKFDVPRLRRAECPPNGRIIDGMDLFHFLYSDLPRGLGYASPFFTRHKPWKHLSGSNMPFYSCMDSLVAWDIYHGCRTRLVKDGLFDIFIRDFVDIEPTFQAMGAVGIGIDLTVQQQLREHYIQLRDNSNAIIQELVPEEVKPFVKKGGYKNPSKEVRLLKQAEPELGTGDAFKRLGYTEFIDETTGQVTYNKRGEFNPNSGLQIRSYIEQVYGVGAIPRNKKDKDKFTTGNEELGRLAARKNDKVLFTIIDSSSAGDKLSSFIDNWPIGADGRVHPTFTNNPATFRLSSVRPNSQNFPHRSEEMDKMREMIIAGDSCDDDWYIVEADYSGIEAIEVGWYAQDSAYMRMAKLGVHSFYASAMPQIGIHLDPKWGDDELKAGIKDVKRIAKSINAEGTETPLYDVAKRVVHGTNYLMGEGLMHDTYPECFPSRKVAKGYQERYYELFPSIGPWQVSVYRLADETNCLVNDFGYRRWFWDAMRWAIDKRTGDWIKVPSGDAKKAVSTLPQGSAAAIIRRAMRSDAFQLLVEEGKPMIQIHDSLVCRARKHEVERVCALLLKAMVYPIKEQGGLIIPVEIKAGKNWRAASEINPNGMREVH